MKSNSPYEDIQTQEFEKSFYSFCTFVALLHDKKMNFATVFLKILENKATKSQTNVVLANSAIAIQTITDKEIGECLSIAKESIESGNALNSLKKIQILSF